MNSMWHQCWIYVCDDRFERSRRAEVEVRTWPDVCMYLKNADDHQPGWESPPNPYWLWWSPHQYGNYVPWIRSCPPLDWPVTGWLETSTAVLTGMCHLGTETVAPNASPQCHVGQNYCNRTNPLIGSPQLNCEACTKRISLGMAQVDRHYSWIVTGVDGNVPWAQNGAVKGTQRGACELPHPHKAKKPNTTRCPQHGCIVPVMAGGLGPWRIQETQNIGCHWESRSLRRATNATQHILQPWESTQAWIWKAISNLVKANSR